VTYSNILEIIADQQERASKRRVRDDSPWWLSGQPHHYLKQGPALDAALARLDEQFAPDIERMKRTESVLASPTNGGR
jgi:hypothetical protein